MDEAEIYSKDESRSEEWHLFDAERGYEARETLDDRDAGYQIRDSDGKVTSLNPEEFDQLRNEGENPRGIA